MKKHIVLLLLLLTTDLFAQEQPGVSSIKTLHILEGTIDNKYPITMYLNIEENKKKVYGKYYYNNIGDFIYLGESILDQNSKLSLKEFTNRSYAFDKEKPSGEFTGTLNKKIVFKGTWSNGKKSFDFELKPRDNYLIQEIEIKTYTFTDKINSGDFEFSAEIFQIANPEKLSGIKKINKELNKLDDFGDFYSSWKEFAKKYPKAASASSLLTSSYNFSYTDNNILSLIYQKYCYAGGAHGISESRPIVYSLDSGKILNKKIDDLVYSVDNEKLTALMRQKLQDYMQVKFKNRVDNDRDIIQNYFDFESIRLNNNYNVDASGITFVYNQYEIAAYAYGIIAITFTYDELKPFVKKTSKLWYLFEG